MSDTIRTQAELIALFQENRNAIAWADFQDMRDLVVSIPSLAEGGSNDETLVGGKLQLTLLTSPSVTITQVGTPGSTAYFYQVSSVNAVTEAPDAVILHTNTGNATLNSTHYNHLAWTAIPGAMSYNVYRHIVGNTPKFIANVTTNSYDDIGATEGSAYGGTVKTGPSILVQAYGTDPVAQTNNIAIVKVGNVETITIDSSGNINSVAGIEAATLTTQGTFKAGEVDTGEVVLQANNSGVATISPQFISDAYVIQYSNLSSDSTFPAHIFQSINGTPTCILGAFSMDGIAPCIHAIDSNFTPVLIVDATGNLFVNPSAPNTNGTSGINVTGLASGTLASPPTVNVGDMWADTTTSATHPIIRIRAV